MIWWLLPFLMIFGGGICGFIKREFDRRHERKLTKINGPRPICGCVHHFSFHNRETGRCMHPVRTAVEWDEYGDAIRWEMQQCGCQRYVGPQPLESLYAPEITTDYTQE